MDYALGMVALLVLVWVNYRLGFNKGYLDGYEKGANEVIDEWRTWLNDFEGD